MGVEWMVWVALATVASGTEQTPAQASAQDATIIAASNGWTTSAVLGMLVDQRRSRRW